MDLDPKKIRIDVHLNHKLVNIENPTRLVNRLLECYFDNKIVIISDENKIELDKIADNVNIDNIVNQILSEIEIVIEKPKPKTKIILGSNKRTKVYHSKNFVTEF